MTRFARRVFIALVALYFATSLGHFGHNAEFLCEYPNLPAAFTRWKVYAAWAAITAVGVAGVALIFKRYVVAGLLLVAVYAAFGLDGLAHYALAPIAMHPPMANVTILSEVIAAALLLATTAWLLQAQWRRRTGAVHARTPGR